MIWHDEYTAYGALTSLMPWGNTAPIVSDGAEILSVTCTPSTANVRVTAKIAGSGGANDQGGVAALFQGSTCKDVVGSVPNNTFFALTPMILSWVGAVTPDEETTFSIRCGPRISGSFYTNGHSASAFWAGLSRCTLDVEEIDLGEA